MVAEKIEAAVRRLSDLEAIRELAHRYAHCVWQKEISAVVGLFAEDGEMNTGDRPVIRGQRALLESYQQMLGAADFHPFVHNHLISLEGDSATGTCYLDLRATIDGESMIGSGYYDDEYVRVDGEWKFRPHGLEPSNSRLSRDGQADRPPAAAR